MANTTPSTSWKEVDPPVSAYALSQMEPGELAGAKKTYSTPLTEQEASPDHSSGPGAKDMHTFASVFSSKEAVNNFKQLSASQKQQVFDTLSKSDPAFSKLTADQQKQVKDNLFGTTEAKAQPAQQKQTEAPKKGRVSFNDFIKQKQQANIDLMKSAGFVDLGKGIVRGTEQGVAATGEMLPGKTGEYFARQGQLLQQESEKAVEARPGSYASRVGEAIGQTIPAMALPVAKEAQTIYQAIKSVLGQSAAFAAMTPTGTSLSNTGEYLKIKLGQLEQAASFSMGVPVAAHAITGVTAAITRALENPSTTVAHAVNTLPYIKRKAVQLASSLAGHDITKSSEAAFMKQDLAAATKPLTQQEDAATAVGSALQQKARGVLSDAEKRAEAYHSRQLSDAEKAAQAKADAEHVKVLRQENDAQAKLHAEKEALTGKQSATQQRVSNAASKAALLKEGFGGEDPAGTLHDFGVRIQNEVQSTRDPLLAKRSAQYDELYKQAIQEGRTKEAQGQYWQDTPGGKAVLQHYKDLYKNGQMTPTDYRAVMSHLSDIFGSKTSPKLSIGAIDAEVRRIGDKSFTGAERGAAISEATARDLRNNILYGVNGKGGIYDWSPKFKAAKEAYKEGSEELKAYRTRNGKKMTAMEQDVEGRPEVDPSKVASHYFSTKQTAEDLISQLGGNAGKAKVFAKQHLTSLFQGLDTKGVNNFLSNQKKSGWVDAFPGLRQEANKYALNLSRTENHLEGYKAVMAQRQKQLEKLATKQEDVAKDAATQRQKVQDQLQKEMENIADARAKGWGDRVDKQATDFAKMVGETDGVNARSVVGKILSSDMSDQQIRALGAHSLDNPVIRENFPGAVADWVSQQDPKNMVASLDKVMPALEEAGLIRPEERANIYKQVLKVQEVLDRGPYARPEKKQYEMAKHLEKVFGGRLVSGFTYHKFEQPSLNQDQ